MKYVHDQGYNNITIYVSNFLLSIILALKFAYQIIRKITLL